MNVRSGKRTEGWAPLIRTLPILILCLVTTNYFESASALDEQSIRIATDKHFTFNGYADIFKSDGVGKPTATMHDPVLIGAPVDPRFEQGEVGTFHEFGAPFGYPEADDLAGLLTSVTAIACVVLTPWTRRNDKAEISIGKTFIRAIITVIVCTFGVRLLGTAVVNCCGTLVGRL